MLKITTHTSDDSTRITLEGRLVGPWLVELERCWRDSEHSAAGRRGIVDLIGVMGYYDLVSMVLNVDRYPLLPEAGPLPFPEPK